MDSRGGVTATGVVRRGIWKLASGSAAVATELLEHLHPTADEKLAHVVPKGSAALLPFMNQR